ncbi:methyl-accepting chemotaxis citrate transducer [Salmonella bongori]|nr:methyl-accepting chemotaxis citrate transducer [Salmonella bongori]
MRIPTQSRAKTLPWMPGQKPALSRCMTFYSSLFTILKADNYEAYGNLDAQKAQDDLEQIYKQWLSQNAQLIKLASDQNQSSFTQMQWTLGIILLIVLAVLAFIWQGLQHVLLRPLQRIMNAHSDYRRRGSYPCYRG